MDVASTIPQLRPAIRPTAAMLQNPSKGVRIKPPYPLSDYFLHAIERLNAYYPGSNLPLGGFVRDELLFGQAILSRDVDIGLTPHCAAVAANKCHLRLSQLSHTGLTPFEPLPPWHDKRLNILRLKPAQWEEPELWADINLCQLGFDSGAMEFIITGNAVNDWANRTITTENENMYKVSSYLARPHFFYAGFQANTPALRRIDRTLLQDLRAQQIEMGLGPDE